jgi:hypothetical protein
VSLADSPYRRAARLDASRRRSADGWTARLARAVFLLAVLAILVPLVRTIFLGFLDDPDTVSMGLHAVWLRAALVVMSLVGFEVHGAVLRGRSREVLALLPVVPSQVVWADLVGVAWRAAGIVAIGAALLLPIALEHDPAAWLVGVGVLVGAATLGLSWAAVALLGAVQVAEDPAWEGPLDLVRGNNPRPQAAIIYALAPVVLVGGYALDQAAFAGVQLLGGATAQAAWLGVPIVAGLAALPAIGPLADRVWFRATMVLEDIRARYATVESAEDAQRVYMDWTVRWLPDDIGRWALLDLRHGWRGHRGWLAPVWVVALLAFAAGWSSTPGTELRAGLVAGTAGWWCGGVMLRMAASVPAFLHGWLPAPAFQRGVARVWVVVAWSLAPAFAAWLAVLMRLGLSASAVSAALAVGSALCAAVVAALAAPRRAFGVIPYAAVGTLSLAASAVVLGAGA